MIDKELRTRKRRPGEQLQKLHSDICRLMSLAYQGPPSEIVNVVGREAFLEALGDPGSVNTCTGQGADEHGGSAPYRLESGGARQE